MTQRLKPKDFKTGAIKPVNLSVFPHIFSHSDLKFKALNVKKQNILEEGV
jgi:hypothetical protein